MVVDLITRMRPDVVAMSVWSTYYQLAARLSRADARRPCNPVVIWGGIHPQTRPEECLEHCDLVARGEGEYVLAELTDRIGLGQRLPRHRTACWAARDGEIVRNPPRLLIPDLDVAAAGRSVVGATSTTSATTRGATWRAGTRRRSSYDIMTVRGCPFECTFCIHNFTRTATEGLGHATCAGAASTTSWPSCARRSRRGRSCGPSPSATTSSRPPRPWLEEFCARYKARDRPAVRRVLVSRAWSTSGASRSCATPDCGSRPWASSRARSASAATATSARPRSEEIIEACNILARHGVVRNLDFIGDNPYETDDDREETLDLLCRFRSRSTSTTSR